MEKRISKIIQRLYVATYVGRSSLENLHMSILDLSILIM